MAVNVKTEIIDKKILKDDIVKFKINSKEIADNAKPGNFLEIRVSDNIEPLLRRPISIYNIDKENGTLYQSYRILNSSVRKRKWASSMFP